MKKYSWIVALVLALSLSALFISCGVDPIVSEPPAGLTYTEVALDNGMNIWAGGKDQQQGWATGDGFKFLGVGDKLETAKDAGYKAEDFKAADFLVFELQPGAPKGGVQIIWGAAEGNDKGISGWNSQRLTSDSGEVDASKGVTVEKGEEGKGDIWKIELKKALSSYSIYKTADEVKILLQYYTGKGVDDLYVANSAKLLIPDVEIPEVPFVEIKSIALATDSFAWTNELKLEGTVSPEDASRRLIIWSIKSWTPKGGAATSTISVTGDPKKPTENIKGPTGVDIPNSSYNTTKTALTGKVTFKTLKDVLISEAETHIDYTVVPPQEVEDTPAVKENQQSKDTIIVPKTSKDASIGTVVIQALVLGGGKDGADYTQDITVTITEAPPSIYFKLGSEDAASQTYGAVQGSITAGTTDGYTATYTKGYASSYAYFLVDFGSGKYSDYSGIKFTYEGVGAFDGDDNDWNNKVIRVYASTEVPTGYNPGKLIAITANSGDLSGATKSKDFDVDFGKGQYGVWNGSSDDLFELDAATDDGGVYWYPTTLDEIGDESQLYIWIVPWSNPVTFKITGIEIKE